MVLGTLATHGPQHGHQIRLIAEVTNVGEWGGVSVGALYRELKLMAIEGLVTEVRTEQVGRRPARTIYAITDQGRMGLASLRERRSRTCIRRRTRSGWRWPSRGTARTSRSWPTG